MGLVENDALVLRQEGVVHRLSQQHTVGHEATARENTHNIEDAFVKGVRGRRNCGLRALRGKSDEIEAFGGGGGGGGLHDIHAWP